MQEKLFSDSEVFQKERPTKLTKQQEDDFYLNQAKDLIDKEYSFSDIEDVIEDLKYLYPFNDNGFEMAKSLESSSRLADYEIDVEFCEWLDCLHYAYSKIENQNIKDWVAAHNPQPKFETGTKLLIVENLNHKLKKDMIVYVNGGRPEEAVYWINVDPKQYGGTIIAYEKVEQCCIVAE
jgi:hypothetical protein